jgi:hypothetical protein
MAKRVIQECDLTKQEYDPDETVVLVIKKKGKQTGRTYELSSSAATKLEQQLVAGKEAALDENWNFSVSNKPIRATNKPTTRTLADLESEEQIIANKQAELRQAGIIEAEREAPEKPVLSGVIETPVNSNGCRHLNKSRIQTTLKGGKRFAFRTCADCRIKIPEMTIDEKKAFMSGKPDPDVNMRDLTS